MDLKEGPMAATDATTIVEPEVGRSARGEIAWRQVPFPGRFHVVDHLDRR
jgi:hypothetical protein